MFTIITPIEPYNFSSSLTDFVLTADKETTIVFSRNNYDVILWETFTPDDKGRIVIRELGKLLESYLVENLVGTFSYSIADKDTLTDKTFVVFYSKVEIDMSAVLFMDAYFLTTLMGEKVTAVNRREYLHLISRSKEDVHAFAKYKIAGEYEEVESIIDRIDKPYQVVTIDVSPERFIQEGKELIGYRIEAGQRKHSFLMDRDSPQTKPDIVFTNSFGCQETIYCRGTFQLEGEYERSHGYVEGKYRAYHVNEKRTYKANTGILTPAMANWVEDLFRSTELYLINGVNIGKEITITESKLVRSADPDELPSFNFEYRYAQRNQNILPIAVAGRIFDATFDHTFN